MRSASAWTHGARTSTLALSVSPKAHCNLPVVTADALEARGSSPAPSRHSGSFSSHASYLRLSRVCELKAYSDKPASETDECTKSCG